eukprot:12873239-Prorocentrum_lima.AAC.1
MSSAFSHMNNFRCSVLVSMTPCSRGMVLRPSKAGTSLFSGTEPLNARFPNSGTPIGTVALVLNAFVAPPTPQTLLRP